jgi:hypothetical protein
LITRNIIDGAKYISNNPSNNLIYTEKTGETIFREKYGRHNSPIILEERHSTILQSKIMSIIKSLVCAVLLLVVQVTNAELYVNCISGPDATPDAPECTNIRENVLTMLDVCTGVAMGYVDDGKPERRNLRSREQAEQSKKRELQWSLDDYCYGIGLSGGGRMICCMQTDNKYSFCGSPLRGRRELQADVDYTQADLADIAAVCSAAFKDLADTNDPPCYGSSGDAFCDAMQISFAI